MCNPIMTWLAHPYGKPVTGQSWKVSCHAGSFKCNPEGINAEALA